MKLTRDGKEIVFIWVPSHVDVRGNSAAKDALKGDISDEIVLFSGMKLCFLKSVRAVAVRVG